ncbi:carboxypeptidase N subunit 2 [Parasteatoda tepidariorum]|uniref:carboxypeptidase N subunit 2 n=1 Tax=Parasteatoda tepidariorum TaxID=114398 RepID=UPI000A2C0ABC|nr:slit homolog 2 protein [Parasteatoda tepidariorum]
MYSIKSHSSCMLSIAAFLLSVSKCYTAPATTSANNNSCISSTNDFDLHCSYLKSFDALNSVLSNLQENVVLMQISNLNWTHIPLNVFRNVSLNTLIISNSTFESFQNSSTDLGLHHLSLENVSFQTKPVWEDFEHLRNLQTLSMYNVTLNSTIDSSFCHSISKSIKSVTIAAGNVSDIRPDSFRVLTSLTYLRISHNKLRTFPKLVLKNPSSLEHLRLDYNRIYSLPSGVFDNLSNLKVLSLSNNSISTLAEEVFSPVWRPDVHVELRDNPIKCDCKLQWAVTSSRKPLDIVGQCAHPKALYGKQIKDLKAEDLSC